MPHLHCPCPFPCSPSTPCYNWSVFFRLLLLHLKKKKTAHGARKQNQTWAHFIFLSLSLLLCFRHIPYHGLRYRSSACPSQPLFLARLSLLCLPVKLLPPGSDSQIPYLPYPFWLPLFCKHKHIPNQEKHAILYSACRR